MFDMMKIAEKLSCARRAKDMTQTEVADALGISFQAVSNWERGSSMPDIARLPEIAALLDLSLDELLDCEKPLADCIASGKTAEYLAGKDICDITALAPIMKPSEVDAVVRKKAETADARDLAELLPFLGQALCDELAEKCWQEKGIGALYEFLPFISGSLRETIAAAEFEKNGLRHFEELAPFLGKDKLRAFAETAIEKEGIRAIAPIAPFLGKDFLAKYVREMYL